MRESLYLNFDLILERVGEEYRARIIDSPAGQASATFAVPFPELELENFVLRMGRPRTGVRRVDSLEMDAVKKCGERLFRAVFTDDVYTCFLRSRDTALEENKGLRVRLRIDVPEFHDYPWELLYNSHLNQFLALSRDTPVVRYLELPYPVQPLKVQPPLRVLAMISSPEGFPQLDVEEEWRRLSDALAPLIRRGLVNLDRLKTPTLSALLQQLRRGEYHIFHFIGHGKYSEHKQDGMLLLEEEGGKGRPVSGQYLGTVLQDHRSLRLVVLNACEGARTSQEDPYAGVAQTLVLQGIPAVIAMQFEIAESAAITFAQEFYGAVADGFPVDAAVSEARKAIFASGNDVEWGTPVLYMRAPQGIIFDIPEAQRAVPPMEEEQGSYVDKEFEQKLEQLYTEGLAAFWVEDWDKACDRFQRILNDRPDHAAAAEKLGEARRQRHLDMLYTHAVDAQKAGDWRGALEALEQLLKGSPEYKDAAGMLAAVRKQKQLGELYAEARKLHGAMKWQAVAKVFAQIHSIDPNHPDPEELLPTAEKKLEEFKRQAQLNDLYSHALREMDAGRWEEAHRLLSQIQGAEPGFMETERLLSKVETRLRQSEEEQKRQVQINLLYNTARGLLGSSKWREALEKIEEIQRLDEQFGDPDKLADRSRNEMAREEEEAERQNKLAGMYAEALELMRGEKYQEALEKWHEIRGVDPGYPDLQLVEWTAQKNLAAHKESTRAKQEAERQNILAGMYAEAIRLVQTEQNREALEKWQEIRTMDPGYPDKQMVERTARKNLAAQEETARVKKQVEHQNRLTAMYTEAVEMVHAEKYREALEKWQEIRSVDPGYPDRQSVERKVRKSLEALSKPETERARFNVRRPLWMALGGVVVLAIIFLVIIRGGKGTNDPALYDNFNKANDQGGYDASLWVDRSRNPKGEVLQQDGVLAFTQGGRDLWTTLNVSRYQGVVIDDSIFFEASLKIDPTINGFVKIYADLDNENGSPMCGLQSVPDGVMAQCWTQQGNPGFPVEYGSWHVARIEVDVNANVVRYYIDGRKLAEDHYDRRLRGSHIMISVGVHAGPDREEASPPMRGYVDNVRIGRLP